MINSRLIEMILYKKIFDPVCEIGFGIQLKLGEESCFEV